MFNQCNFGCYHIKTKTNQKPDKTRKNIGHGYRYYFNDANHNVSGIRMDDAVEMTNRNNTTSLCEQENGYKTTTTVGNINTAAAMIQDKIVLGIVSTKKDEEKGEKGEKEDIELENVTEDSESMESLWDEHQTTTGNQ
eukprot:104633_1